MPHKLLQIVLLEALNIEGYAIERDFSVGDDVWHCNIWLPQTTTVHDIVRLISCFGEPVDNPFPKEKK